MLIRLLLIILGLLPLAACFPVAAEQNTWLYQLQRAEPGQIAGSGYEIAVIDPTANGKDSTRYTKSEVASVTEGGTNLLAYLSIGEASAFKSYWNKNWGQEVNGTLIIEDNAPQWLGRIPNPSWPESVKVRYWEEEWWNILKPELDRIKAAGFNGVYLDIIDAYYYWGREQTYKQENRLPGDPGSEKEAAERMMNLVERISAYMKDGSPNFKVFPQNAESILQYDEGSYLKAIDGMGSEDLWFNEDKRSTPEITESRLTYLKQVTDAGKPVLSVDYVHKESPGASDLKRIKEYYDRCEQEGFYCFAGAMDRELDEFIPK